MIPDEVERLIYHCIMGGGLVLVSPDDELAAEHFKELRKVCSLAADELKLLLEKTEREITQGYADYEPVGISVELCKPIEMSRQIITPMVKQIRVRNNYLKRYALPLKRRSRCRWRQRESRRSLDGLSPGVVIVDEGVFAKEV